ncbi:MAG: hypothetical protein PHH69_05340 [Candidatus Omnitrophica bacterium]|nr:hypothetical protein [Candidatus Omnitrophota bacterium]MDD5610947.1 hypothetical protein [Candidatus Omnitrophota bacterium]
MADNKLIPDRNEIPILSLIQQVKDNTIDPKTLDKELRQACVEVFLVEGYSISGMAQILNRSEKTIHRDIEEIRDRNALSPNAELAKKLIGELLVYSRSHRDHLMRLSRSKEGSISERAQAEYYAARVWLDLTARLQSIGYLPSSPQAFVGDIFCHMDDAQDQKEAGFLIAQAKALEAILKETNASGEEPIKEISQISNEMIKLIESPKVQDKGVIDEQSGNRQA